MTPGENDKHERSQHHPDRTHVDGGMGPFHPNDGERAKGDDNRAANHQRHGDAMQNAFELEPAAHNQGNANRHQRQHDVQVADDRALQGGFVGHSDQIFSQKRFMPITPIGAGDGAESGRNQGRYGHHKESEALQVQPISGMCMRGIGRQLVRFFPGP